MPLSEPFSFVTWVKLPTPSKAREPTPISFDVPESSSERLLERVGAAPSQQAGAHSDTTLCAVRHCPQGLVDWLLSCPEKDFFVPIEFESISLLPTSGGSAPEMHIEPSL